MEFFDAICIVLLVLHLLSTPPPSSRKIIRLHLYCILSLIKKTETVVWLSIFLNVLQLLGG